MNATSQRRTKSGVTPFQVISRPKPAVSVLTREVLDTLEEEVARTLRQARNNPQRAIKLGLARLAANGDISENDLRRLSKITELVSEVERKRRLPSEAADEIRKIHQEALSDSTSSGFALTTMSASTSPDDPSKTIALFGLVGAVLGAAAGAAIGGGLGGAAGAEAGWELGAAIGIIVGSIIGAACAAD